MSSPDETSARDLAAAYALGALSDEDARAFEAHLAASPEAQRELAELRETAALLALAGGDSPGAPPDLRARVLQAIGVAGRDAVLRPATRAAPRRVRPAAVAWAALAAAVLVAVGLGIRVRILSLRLAEVERTASRQSQTIAEQGRQLLDREAALAAILSPDVKVVPLTASGSPEPRVRLYWDRRRHTALLHATGLKPAPQGRTYQLWFIRDGQPVPSVTFNVEPGGEALVRQVTVPTDGSLSAAAITEEPAGGSEHPTSPVLLVGALAGKA